MMEWAIGAVAATTSHATWDSAARTTTAQTPRTSDAFATLIRSGVSELNTDVRAAEAALGELAAGKGVELHDVMIALERAQLSVQTFVQVRNKLVEAYQDLTRMQL